MTAGWDAPGPGSWELDDLHKATTYTRPFLELAAPAMGDGFALIGERYGLPFDRLDVRSVQGKAYGRMVVTAAPPPKAGKPERVPPAAALRVLCRVHPALRRRAKAAVAALADRRWLVEAEAWWATERPPRSPRTSASSSASPRSAPITQRWPISWPTPPPTCGSASCATSA